MIPKSIKHQTIKTQFSKLCDTQDELIKVIGPDYITWAANNNQPGFEIVSFPKVVLLSIALIKY